MYITLGTEKFDAEKIITIVPSVHVDDRERLYAIVLSPGFEIVYEENNEEKSKMIKVPTLGSYTCLGSQKGYEKYDKYSSRCEEAAKDYLITAYNKMFRTNTKLISYNPSSSDEK